MKAWTVKSSVELEAALKQGFDCESPSLLDIHVESLAERVPPVYSWLAKRGEDPLSSTIEDIAYL